MTRPKWMRKRAKAMVYLNKLMGFTLRLGYISLDSKSKKRNIRIHFYDEELDKFDQEKFSTYFGVVIQTIKDCYRDAGQKRKTDKKYKAIIMDKVEEIVNGILWIVYANWEEYGYEVTL